MKSPAGFSVITFSFLSFQRSSSFLIQEVRPPIQLHHDIRLRLQMSQGDNVQTRPMRPVFVVGEPHAAMGAATALCAFDVLTGRTTIPSDERGSPPPQPVALFAAATDVSWEDKLRDKVVTTGNLEPILHIPIEASAVLTPEIRNGISSLGVNIQESPGIVPPDMAQSTGSKLQQFLDSLQNQDRPVAFVSMGLSLHLAMLQANCLPKSQASRDCYHVLMPEGGSIHVDYLYDDSSASGGDPLSCPTKEVVISTPPTFATAKRSETSAAAYSALRGNGMDSISSAAIAAGVATILGDSDSGSGISWSTIQRTVQLSRHIREFGAVAKSKALTQKYSEYGYK